MPSPNRPVNPSAIWSTLAAIAIAVIIYFARPYFTSPESPAKNNNPTATHQPVPTREPTPRTDQPSARTSPPTSSDSIRYPNIAFRSRTNLEDHFKKHAQDTGATSIDDYLKKAQSLRDAPLAPPMQEIKRADGVITRFDPRTGYFLAANADRTIRTFFRPADGQAYFTRQAQRPND